jgi:acetyl esterase/lipase
MNARCAAAWVLLLAVWASWVRAGVAQEAGKPEKIYEVEEIKRLAYRRPALGELLSTNQLDLYLPKGAKDYPVVLIVHGGVWVVGDKTLDRIPAIARALARQGYGAAATNYRLSPWVRHPTHAQDVVKALAWLEQNIAEHGGDPNRVFLMGHSAGGHLVALVAADQSYLEKEGVQPSVIRGVVSLSGVYDVTEIAVQDLFKHAKVQVDAKLTKPFAAIFGNDANVISQASPISHVRPGLPPFLIVCGDHDLPGLENQAAQFARELKAKNNEVTFLRMKGRNHWTTFWSAQDREDPIGEAVTEFLNKHRQME